MTGGCLNQVAAKAGLTVRSKKLERKRKCEREIERIRKDILNMGGECKTKRDLRNLLAKNNSVCKKMQCLKTQLLYHKKVIKTQVTDKTLYQFSRKGNCFNVSTLRKNLITVIQQATES